MRGTLTQRHCAAARPQPATAAPRRPPACAAHTPISWRIASLGILLGGALVGRTVGRSPLVWGAVAQLPVIVAAGAIRAGRARRHGQSVPGAQPGSTGSPDVTVLISARDEANVVAEVIGDLACQDYRDAQGVPRFEVIVIDDRSTDGTGAAVRREADALGIGFITRIVRRDNLDLTDGKGAALAAVPPEMCREAIVVLDADARVAPSFLRLAASHLTDRMPAVQARRRVLGATARRLARLQADEQVVDGTVQARRWAAGGCSEFRGNGMVIRRDALIGAGGWQPGPLTEDLDLSSRLAATSGRSVGWPLDLEVWESPVERLRDLWAQRLRWAEGSIRRYLEHGPSVMRSGVLSRSERLDFAIYGGQLLAPPFTVGLVAGAMVDRRAAGPAIILGASGIAVLALSYDALHAETSPTGDPLDRRTRTSRALAVAAFESLWIPVVPVALWRLATRRGPLRFAKMPHRSLPFTDLNERLRWPHGVRVNDGSPPTQDRLWRPDGGPDRWVEASGLP